MTVKRVIFENICFVLDNILSNDSSGSVVNLYLLLISYFHNKYTREMLYKTFWKLRTVRQTDVLLIFSNLQY